jgi:hypothetical protein
MSKNTSFYSYDMSGLSSSLVNGATANNILNAYNQKYPDFLLRKDITAPSGVSVDYNYSMIDTLKNIDSSMYADMLDK